MARMANILSYCVWVTLVWFISLASGRLQCVARESLNNALDTLEAPASVVEEFRNMDSVKQCISMCCNMKEEGCNSISYMEGGRRSLCVLLNCTPRSACIWAFYPLGTTADISHEDDGETPVFNSTTTLPQTDLILTDESINPLLNEGDETNSVTTEPTGLPQSVNATGSEDLGRSTLSVSESSGQYNDSTTAYRVNGQSNNDSSASFPSRQSYSSTTIEPSQDDTADTYLLKPNITQWDISENSDTDFSLEEYQSTTFGIDINAETEPGEKNADTRSTTYEMHTTLTAETKSSAYPLDKETPESSTSSIPNYFGQSTTDAAAATDTWPPDKVATGDTIVLPEADLVQLDPSPRTLVAVAFCVVLLLSVLVALLLTKYKPWRSGQRPHKDDYKPLRDRSFLDDDDEEFYE